MRESTHLDQFLDAVQQARPGIGELAIVATTGPSTYKNIEITIIGKSTEFPLIEITAMDTERRVGIIKKNITNTAYSFLGNDEWSASSGVLRDIARLLDGMNADGEIRI